MGRVEAARERRDGASDRSILSYVIKAGEKKTDFRYCVIKTTAEI